MQAEAHETMRQVRDAMGLAYVTEMIRPNGPALRGY